jgi:hypothetical protein
MYPNTSDRLAATPLTKNPPSIHTEAAKLRGNGRPIDRAVERISRSSPPQPDADLDLRREPAP